MKVRKVWLKRKHFSIQYFGGATALCNDKAKAVQFNG